MTAATVFRSSTAYLAVTAAELFATLVSVPIMTRYLSPAEYAVMLLISNIVAFVNLVFAFPFAQALPTLFVGTADLGQRRAIATTILVTIAAILFAFYAFIGSFAEPASLFLFADGTQSRPLLLGALAGFVSAVGLCLAALARLVERPLVVLAAQMPATAIQLCVLLYSLIVARAGLSALYLAMTAGALFAVAVYLFMMIDILSGPLRRRIVADAGRIGIRLLPWQAGTYLATSTAGFFLIRSGHINEAGLYSIAASLVAVLVSISNSFAGAWTPYVLLRHAAPDLAQTQKKVFEIYSSGLMVAAAGLTLFAREIFFVLLGLSFRQAYHFVPPLVLAYCLFCFANSFSQGLQAKQRMDIYGWIGCAMAVVFLGVCLPLVHRYGVLGLITAMGAAFLTMLVLLQRTSRRLMPVDYPWRRHGAMWAVASVLVGMCYGLGESVQGTAVKVLAMLVIAGLPFVFGALTGANARDVWALRRRLLN